MKRGTKVALLLGALLTIQLSAYAVYRTVEARRGSISSSTSPVVVSGETGTLLVHDRAGSATNLGDLSRPTVVHFWATSCEPCRQELPALLDLADAERLRIKAVSLDAGWEAVDEMLGGRRSPSLYLGSPDDAKRRLGVRTLPATFLIDEGGALRLRADGARDWRSAPFVSSWAAAR